MSQIQGLSGLAFTYQDQNQLPDIVNVTVTGAYGECVNVNGGPSFGGAVQVLYYAFWNTLADRQADLYLSNSLPVDQSFYQEYTPYVKGNDDYNTAFSLLQAKFPSGTATDPYP